MKSKDYEVILDSLQSTGIYVIREDNHQILYFNKRVKEVAPGIQKGMVCHELWSGSCANCPLLYIGNKKESRSINYDDPFGKAVDIVATRIMWENTTPAFSIAVTPHQDAVSYIYSKILKADLTVDSYEIMQLREEEKKNLGKLPPRLTEWIEQFIKEGNVYKRDEERFRKFLETEHLQKSLKSGEKKTVCTYRYRSPGGFRWNVMEVVPDLNGPEDHRNVMIYVKDVHDVYRTGLELEEVNLQNQEIIKSLGELNFAIYVVDLHTGLLNPVRVPEDVETIISSAIPEWDQVFAKMVGKLYHPKYREEILQTLSLKALRESYEKKEKKRELVCERKLNGEYRYVSITPHYFENDCGDPYVVMAFLNVDERKRQEIKRSQNDRRMAAIIKSRFRVMNTIDLDSGICERVYFNESDSVDRIKTGDYDSNVRRAAKEMILEEDMDAFLELLSIDNLRKKAEKVDDFLEEVGQFRCRGPEEKWIEEHLFMLRQDKTVMVNVLGRDITEEKQKEVTAISEKLERNQIIDSMSSLFFATYYIDLETESFRAVTQKQEVDNAIREKLNCTEAFRIYAERFVHPDDREEYLQKMCCENMRKSLSPEHRFFAVEYRRIANEDGKIRDNGWIRATVVLAEMKNGKPDKVLYVAQNVSEIKEKEERERRILKEAYDSATHANASKSEFLSRMSHDIRTPMNAIIGMTAIAGTHLDDKERVADCLTKITTSSKHLLSLVNEVLDMSKIESGKINLSEEEFNLSDLVQSMLTIIRPSVQAKKQELTLHVGKINYENVVGDILRLQQVFMNILGNAVKYTPEGGRIEVEINEKISNSYGYGCYEFIFKDSGIGMSEEYQKKIFEPFSRAEDSRVSKIEGTGLGMTIAYNIVQMMNGSIDIESREGEGSKFTVTIFLKQRNTVEEGIEQFADLPVLVVDDDPYDCKAACTILDEIGMKSEGVLSGREAVKLVCEAKQAGKGYFAVILDWKMPGMDGIETARAIRREAGPDVTIIILSAYDWSEVEEEASGAGIDGFISKPMFKSRLIYLLKKITGRENDRKEIGKKSFSDYNFEGKRILLVEDNELNREIAEEIIRSTGVIVESAADGKQALEKFQEKDEWYYDLIFMDIQMPVMNGHEAAKAIRKLNRKDAAKIPIIAMTANAFTEDAIASRNAGMNEHVTKPLNIEQLMECMNRWFLQR